MVLKVHCEVSLELMLGKLRADCKAMSGNNSSVARWFAEVSETTF